MADVVDLTLLAEVFITLFVIMDPPGTVPIFLGLTAGMDGRGRREAAWQAVLVAILVITAFAVFGQGILSYLGISLAALQGAGGLLLLLVSLELLMGNESSGSGGATPNVAMVPLGTPLLAGPGAIVATMVFAQGADERPESVAVAAGIAAVHVVLWMSMRWSGLVLRVLREAGVTLLTRISGLLLSAIAVQLVADSVRAFVEGTG